MTPSEIADLMDDLSENLLDVREASYAVCCAAAAATIRELEAKCSEGALQHAATIRLASDIEAKLKIATEALDAARMESSEYWVIVPINEALARIKEL